MTERTATLGRLSGQVTNVRLRGQFKLGRVIGTNAKGLSAAGGRFRIH